VEKRHRARGHRQLVNGIPEKQAFQRRCPRNDWSAGASSKESPECSADTQDCLYSKIGMETSRI